MLSIIHGPGPQPHFPVCTVNLLFNLAYCLVDWTPQTTKKRFVKIAQNSDTPKLSLEFTPYIYSQTDLFFHFPVSQHLKPSTSRQPLLDLHKFQPCYTMTVWVWVWTRIIHDADQGRLCQHMSLQTFLLPVLASNEDKFIISDCQILHTVYWYSDSLSRQTKTS